jgi:hypothetical protein
VKVVLPGVSSTPNLDGGGIYSNKDVTITESGPGPLIPVGRRISEDWFPRGPGHETLLPITSAFPEPARAILGPIFSGSAHPYLFNN